MTREIETWLSVTIVWLTTEADNQSSLTISLFHSFIFSFGASMLLVGRQEGHPACKKTEWWGTGVVVCLEQGADLHIWPS